MSCLKFYLIPVACSIPNTLQTFLSLLLILSKICFRVANPARVIGAGYWRKQKSAYENQKT
jgi:hypothetical protein